MNRFSHLAATRSSDSTLYRKPIQPSSLITAGPAGLRVLTDAGTERRFGPTRNGDKGADKTRSPANSGTPAKLKGFGRRPLARRSARRRGPASESLTRRKPRGGWGPVGARRYGDFGVADRARRLRMTLEAADGVDRRDGFDRIGSRECEGRARIGRVIGVCRGCEAIAVVVRGAAASECDRRCWRAGGAAAVMRCRP